MRKFQRTSAAKRSTLLATLWSCAVFAGFPSCLKKQNAVVKSEKSGEAQPFDFKTYAQACEQALGPAPAVNCMEIDEVVMWSLNSDHKLVRLSDKNEPGVSVAYVPKSNTTCLNPSLAGPKDDRCMPFARIGVVKGANSHGTVWVADCRKADMFTSRTSDIFESVGLIGHNAESGATCFFDTKRKDKGFSASALPAPTDVVKASEVWLTPEEMNSSEATQCVRCHSAYPWLRTPPVLHRAVAQHFEPQSALLAPYYAEPHSVPENFKIDVPKDGQKHPYVVVSQQNFDDMSKKGIWSPKEIDTPGNDVCVACHRVGGSYFTARKVAQGLGFCNLLGQGVFVDRFNSHCRGVQMPEGNFDWHAVLFNVKNWRGAEAPESVQHKEVEEYYKDCYTGYIEGRCKEISYSGTVNGLTKN